MTVERIGLEFFYQWVEGHELHTYDQPSVIEFALKGQRDRADAGRTEPQTNHREWTGRTHPILQVMPPRATPAQVEEGLRRLREAAEPPAGSNPPLSYVVDHEPPDYYEG